MPEGDTIYRSARALHRALAGHTVLRFHTAYARIASADDQEPFAGQIVTEVEARGKWLLMRFSGAEDAGDHIKGRVGDSVEDRILATHMLMSGSWHIYRPGERWREPRSNARIEIETADFVAVAFRVPVARIHTARSLARDPAIPRAEGDVLGEGFSAEAALRRLKGFPDEELANVLLRQHVLAGVGNVFKSEICFLLGLSPFRKVATLSQQQAEEIVATAQRLLAANVLEDSGDRIVTYQGFNRRTTRNAQPSDNLWVYGRRGEACRRCGTAIERCLQGQNARSTYWCPACQPPV